MLTSFKDNIVIVTGSARGIGKNLAIQFASAGAHVIIADCNEALGATVSEEIERDGNSAEFFKVDLGEIAEVELMIDHFFRKHGHLDVLINNARGGFRTSPLQETEVNLQMAFEISLKAPLFASQSFIRAVDANKNHGGCILNISSVVTQSICHESAAYHLTKAALENLTRYLAVHGGAKGVRVNAVRAGFIVQDEHQIRYRQEDNHSYRQLAEFCHPLKRVGASNDVAHAVLFLCSEQASFITGQVLTVDGGLTIQDPYWLLMQCQNNYGPSS